MSLNPIALAWTVTETKRKFNVRSELSVVSAGSLPRFALKARRFFRVKD